MWPEAQLLRCETKSIMREFSTKNKQEVLSDLCNRFQVHALYVFGSRAKEVMAWIEKEETELTKGPSDVDIGIRTGAENKWNVKDKVLFIIALEDYFRCSRVDLIILEEADPFVAAEAIRGERLFSRDDYDSDEYELFVLRRAGDLIPFERERQALILRDEV